MRNEDISRLNKLWIYSIKNFKIYRDISEKYSIYSIKTLEDWSKIPYLDKENYIKYQETIFKELRDIKGYLKTTMTGGSSSTPTIFPNYESDVFFVRKGLYDLRKKAGLSKLNRDFIHIWGHSHLISKYGYGKYLIKFKENCKRLLMNQKLISGYNPTKYLNQFIKAVKSKRYSWIIGYSTAIYSLARYTKEKNIKVKGCIDYIILTSENITQYSIDLIEKVFDTIVIKEYGSAELGVVAYSSLDSKKYFFDTNNFYIERFLDDKLINTVNSKIQITTLNRVFPLIKYCNDDSFKDFKIEDSRISCEDVIGRDLEEVVKLKLKNNKLSGPMNEIFIVHCLKTVRSIAQITSFVDKSKILKKLRVHYTGSSNYKNIREKIYKTLEEEVDNFDKRKIEIEISNQPLKTVAGKSINYVNL